MKNGGWKTSFLLGRTIFGGYVGFREGIWWLYQLYDRMVPQWCQSGSHFLISLNWNRKYPRNRHGNWPNTVNPAVGLWVVFWGAGTGGQKKHLEVELFISDHRPLCMMVWWSSMEQPIWLHSWWLMKFVFHYPRRIPAKLPQIPILFITLWGDQLYKVVMKFAQSDCPEVVGRHLKPRRCALFELHFHRLIGSSHIVVFVHFVMTFWILSPIHHHHHHHHHQQQL